MNPGYEAWEVQVLAEALRANQTLEEVDFLESWRMKPSRKQLDKDTPDFGLL
jgi:hypothetical protein